MKLFVLTFSLFFIAQLGFNSCRELRPDVQSIRNATRALDGVSEQFVEDVDVILDKFQNSTLILEFVDLMIKEIEQKNDVNFEKELSKSMKYRAMEVADTVKVIQTILLKQLPPERINGVINILYAMRPNGSEIELDSAMNYFYGVEKEAPFTEIPNANTTVCLYEKLENRRALSAFESMIDLRPKVRQDYKDIFSKFSCHMVIAQFLQDLAHILTKHLHGANKIDACIIKNSASELNQEEFDEEMIFAYEMYMETRLSEDTYRGLINVYKAFGANITDNEIQKALEYLYDGVPTIEECTESFNESTSNTELIPNGEGDKNDCKKLNESIAIIRKSYPADEYVFLNMKNFIDYFAKIEMYWKREPENLKLEYETEIITNLRIFQELLLRRLQPEQINAVINMMYAFRPSAAYNEIETAKEYLCNSPEKAPFINISETILPRNCSVMANPAVIDHIIVILTVKNNIKSKVRDDLRNIAQKFDCVANMLADYMLVFLDIENTIRSNTAKTSKIDACMIKNKKQFGMIDTRKKEKVEMSINSLESILSLRLSDENFRGIVDVMKVFLLDGTKKEMEKALEYLYVDVPTVECLTCTC